MPLFIEAFWDLVKPKDGAIEYVKKLYDNNNYEIFLCTSTDYRIIKMKYEFAIKKYFPYIDWRHVIITYQKQFIDADFIIDDGIHNLIGGKAKKILFNAPHNKNVKINEIDNEIIRAYNWKEIYDYIINYK